jgi:hypothetical protein
MNELSQFDDELLSAYLDDELTPEERARVEERLATDPAARQLLDELRTVSQTMKELPAVTLGADLRESVLRRAERAMLVPGEQPADSKHDRMAAFPIGRSKRAWFWAGAALAAGLMLMIFQRDPARDRDLPNEVAKNERDSDLVRSEPLSSLEFRAVEPLADRQNADDLMADNRPPVDSVSQLAKETAPVSLGREAERSMHVATAPTGGGSGGGGFPHMHESVRFKESDADAGKDLLVVHVNMKPEALHGRAFDDLLVKCEIDVEEPTVEQAPPSEPQDVDVVIVEAVPLQVYKCLDEIKKDENNYLGVAVDDRQANSQKALAAGRPEADMKQYNRGVVPNQQQVELAPDNHYYFKADPSQTESEQLVRDGARSKESQIAEQPSQQTRGRYLARGEATAPSAAAPAAPLSTSGATNVLSADASSPASGASAQGDFYAGAKVSVARRAIQQLETKADTLQVMFVLTCPSFPLESAAATSLPATPLPDSAAPAQEGLKSGE